jgi:hypothetical protein
MTSLDTVDVKTLSPSREELRVDQKVSAHLMSTIEKVTGNVQSVPRQSPDTY